LTGALPRLRRYAIALTGDVSIADDLVQDCMERAWKNQNALRDEATIYPWLRSILHNLNIDRVRLRRRRPDAVESLDAVLNETLSGHRAADDPAPSMDVTRAMNRLTVEHRQVLLLSALEGLSYRDIADELGVPIGTVMSRLARAREQLRTLLKADI
jgi:RNA polymerase sigma-70 factor (ECF subfamily)